MGAKINEVDVVVDYSKIDVEVDAIYKEINDKIATLESRINTLRDKEKMLDKFIFANHAQLEAADSKNYKLRNQLQISISKQLEIQQLVIDTIIKYEKIIQDYSFQKQKLQNDKLSNYLKWKKGTESNADEKKFLEVLKKFEEATKEVSNGVDKASVNPVENNEMIKAIVEQTYSDGYKI